MSQRWIARSKTSGRLRRSRSLGNRGEALAALPDLIRSFRPRQWVKNLFIAAPALFSLEILNPAVWLTLAAGFGGLSALASGLYLLNDLRDRDEDRLHPLKKYRPVASGKVSVATAVVACVLLLCGGLLTLSLLPGHSLRVGIAYTGIMLLYTLFLRRVMVLDVIVIATGFVLRVLMGGR
ncbi:MAG: hypothetical protein FJY67_04320 [Calditrichaeota bacterium]|nr:hypothetical protein [Calditrichota bacterium]